MIITTDELKEIYGKSRIMFFISEDSIQATALEVVGRELTEDELLNVAKGLEWGIGDTQDIIVRTAIREATGT